MTSIPTSLSSSECNDSSDATQKSVSRPNNLQILFNDLTSPSLSSIPTPQMEDALPILKNEFERILRQLTSSPLTPSNLLNNTTEENEKLISMLTQKVNELSGSTTSSPNTTNSLGVSAPTGLPNPSALPTPSLEDLCNQVNIQNSLSPSQQPILLYSPVLGGLNPKFIPLAKTLENQITSGGQDGQQAIITPAPTLQSETQLVDTVTRGRGDSTLFQLPNGLRFEITTKNTVPQQQQQQASVLDLLGLANSAGALAQPTPHSESVNIPMDTTATISTTGPLMTVTTDTSSSIPDKLSPIHNNNLLVIDQPQQENDVIMGSQNILSSSSTSSSVSTSSQQQQPVTAIVVDDHQHRQSGEVKLEPLRSLSTSSNTAVKLDPNEQFRMRLERKRARNRDAARKCRERKIRLIKSLEKDVQSLQEDTKLLKSILNRSRVDIEQMKLFVSTHIDNPCPDVANVAS